MMTLLGIAAVVLLGVGFPRAADVAAWLMTLFFIAPIVLVAVGTAVYSLSTGFGWDLSARACYWGYGGAAALLMSYFILRG